MVPTGEYVVTDGQNAHGCLTVRAATENATYQIVDYRDSDLERNAAELSVGTRCTAELTRAGRRSNVWRAESLRPIDEEGATPPTNGS